MCVCVCAGWRGRAPEREPGGEVPAAAARSARAGGRGVGGQGRPGGKLSLSRAARDGGPAGRPGPGLASAAHRVPAREGGGAGRREHARPERSRRPDTQVSMSTVACALFF